jgi:hypothetical protein
MADLTLEIYGKIISPGPRLPWIKKWLLEEIWSQEKYETMSRINYLRTGEENINKLEEIIAASAPRVYDEFLEPPPPDRDVLTFLKNRSDCAVAIFDGLSLREMPILKKMCEESGFEIHEFDASWGCVPSETMDFIEQRLKLTNTSPVQLPNKPGLKELGISAYYYTQPSDRRRLNKNDTLLLWSSFPDSTYGDSGARFPQHFDQIHTLLETAWRNTVQDIPKNKTIIVTSDHGYVFFGPGLSFPRSNEALRPLNAFLRGERFCRFEKREDVLQHPDLKVIEDKRLALIKGRVQTHPPGTASTKLYKHGGLSIMEMLVPWIKIKSVQNSAGLKEKS